MIQKKTSKALSVKLSVAEWKMLDSVAPGEKNSEKIRGLIRGGFYMSRIEATEACVDLMDTIQDLQGNCPVELYERVRKAGGRGCRSLLIK